MLTVYNKDFETLKQNYNAIIKKDLLVRQTLCKLIITVTRNFTFKRMFEKGLKICKIEDGK